MNFLNIISRKLLLLGALVLLAGTYSCELEEIPDPNGSSLDNVLANASRSDLQTVITGIESLLRTDIGFYYDVTGIIGREYYFFTGSDPRYTGELLGRGQSVLDNAGFYGTRPYAARYRTIKNANILIEAVNNNSDKLSFSPQQINGYIGFAKTIQAYELHLVLNLQYQNGIRIDVSDPDNLGPFVDYDQALTAIRSLLDEAATAIGNAGNSFDFVLSSGFEGFDTPQTFLQFVNGLAARIAIYQNDKAAALNYLNKSFVDMNGDLNMGPARPFSTAGGERVNPVFRAPNQADALVAHPSYVQDIDPSDARLSRVAQRNESISLDGLTSEYDVVYYSSLDAPIPFIRNEELILIMAEANIGSNNTAAVAALDAIRTANGIGAYSGGTSDAELVDEMLNQRRFSLFGDGHRWVDMRRYDRLDQLPIDRTDDDVWVQMPRPVSEP